MTLTQKVSLALSVAFVMLCVLLWVALQASIAPQFEAFEYEKARDNFERAQNGVTRELHQLEAYRRDYGVWDEAYNFTQGTNPDFLKEELPVSLLQELGLNIYIYLGAEGSVLDGIAIDSETNAPVSVEKFAPVRFKSWRDFQKQLAHDEVRQSVLSTPGGLMLVAYAPVTRTDGSGDYVGHLLTGRIVDAAFISGLQRQTRVDMNVEPVTAGAGLKSVANQSLVRKNGEISISAPLRGVDGAPVAMLIARTPSDITAIGQRTLLSAFLLLAIVLLLFIVIVNIMVRRLAVRPIERLTAIMRAGDSETLEHDECLAARRDEVGVLYASFNSLIGRIGAHTSELASALTAAESAERAKTQFLANMSHEIRTPMNGVMGMADLLAGTKLTETQKSFVDVIGRSGDALLTIINDILDFSKLDAGMMALNSAPFVLVDVVEDVSTLLAARAREKDIELVVRVDPTLAHSFIGDAGRLRQILINLAGNAVKFTEHGHVLIDVSSQAGSDGDGSLLKFSICDTGIGIPKDKCAEIFEKFSQADTSTTRAHEGTGLGLAIAKALVELMGGKINVTSVEGEGSTFWFTIGLPVNSKHIPEKQNPTVATAVKILIVDDNEVNRKILEEQAAAWNFISVSCASGAAALTLLRAAHQAGEPFSVVVMDYQMPGMNGEQTVRHIRTDPMISNIPVVMLTSVDQVDVSEHFSALGIGAHLTKPARSGALLGAISQVLHQTAEAPESKPIASGAAAVDTPAAEHAGGALDVLVAEDNEVNRLVMSHILKANGFGFKMAVNGREAVDMYELHKPKLVLMDISMPVMNGFEATAAIRAIEAKTGEHTPIIGVTAHAVKGDHQICTAAGMDDYLPKPVSPKMLSEKIARYLQEAASNAA